MSVSIFEPARGKIKGDLEPEVSNNPAWPGGGRKAGISSRRHSHISPLPAAPLVKSPAAPLEIQSFADFALFIDSLGGINMLPELHNSCVSALKLDLSLYFWAFLDQAGKLPYWANYFHLPGEQRLLCLF